MRQTQISLDQTTANDTLSWLDSVVDAIYPTRLPTTGPSSGDTFPLLNSEASSGEDQSPQPPTTASALSPVSRTPNAADAGPSRSATASKPAAAPSKPPRRRIRPKISLDPHQPLTARGKPRARVYVACNQCRIRKTRCDGAKPVCFNCCKRPPEVGKCSYDGQPKRRGQDKVPGTRVRSTSQKAVKRQRSSQEKDNDDEHSGSESTSGRSQVAENNSSLQLWASYENFPGFPSPEDSAEEYDPFPLVDLDPPSANSEYYTPPERPQEESPSIPPQPGLQFTRETWWDALLTFYSTDEGGTDTTIITLSSAQRTSTVQRVVSDLRALFHSSLYWVSFLHIPRFFAALLDPTCRPSMQPSLVLSALAVGIFAQSSEAEQGAPGRAKALKLLDLAYSSLQASLSSGWVDIGLIQAAWFIVYFEMQSHPLQSVDRNRSSLLLLDSLIRLFSLTTLDADLKRAHQLPNLPLNSPPFGAADPLTFLQSNNHAGASPFPFSSLNPGCYLQPGLTGSYMIEQTVPREEPIVPDNITLGPSTTTSVQYCNCSSFSVKHNCPSVLGIAPSFAGTPMWPEQLPEGEFRKEECRRLVWASVMVTASMNSYTSVLEDIEKNRLWIKDPDNYVLMFPGESLAMAGMPIDGNNVWTLYLRSMLLLHTCVRNRGDVRLSDCQRAPFAMRVWLEIDAIENALNQHTCEVERNLGFQAREMLFSSRMCVSHEFQRYIPLVTTNGSKLFYRDKAEAWLRHRMLAAERVWQNLLSGIHTPALDYRKPLLIYWFMSHVIKALVLWRVDATLIIALEASKTFVKRLEYLMMFWPSSVQRAEWQRLRYELVQACVQCGVSPPELNLPAPVLRASRKDAA